MARKLEENREAMAFWESVNAILQHSGYRKDRKLAEQTSAANDSIPANISEGFEQPTDGAFAITCFTRKARLERFSRDFARLARRGI